MTTQRPFSKSRRWIEPVYFVRNSNTACFGVPYIEDDSDDEIDEETDTFKPKEISDERLFSEEKYFSQRGCSSY